MKHKLKSFLIRKSGVIKHFPGILRGYFDTLRIPETIDADRYRTYLKLLLTHRNVPLTEKNMYEAQREPTAIQNIPTVTLNKNVLIHESIPMIRRYFTDSKKSIAVNFRGPCLAQMSPAENNSEALKYSNVSSISTGSFSAIAGSIPAKLRYLLKRLCLPLNITGVSFIIKKMSPVCNSSIAKSNGNICVGKYIFGVGNKGYPDIQNMFSDCVRRIPEPINN